MANDTESLNVLRQLIQEVKQELKNKKIIAENKTPEEVFNNHEKNMKKFVSERVLETLKLSEK